MNATSWMLVLVVVLALVFDYINGFHDSANAWRRVVQHGVLPLRTGSCWRPS